MTCHKWFAMVVIIGSGLVWPSWVNAKDKNASAAQTVNDYYRAFSTFDTQRARADDTVYLTCSGTFNMPGNVTPASVSVSAAINFDQGMIVSSIGVLRIITVNADSVNARGSYVDENGTQVFLSFRINRITGRTTVIGTHGDWIEPDNDPTLVVLWDLMCRPVQPLF